MKKIIFSIALLALVVLSVTNILAAPSLSLSWITAPAELYQGQSRAISANITNTGDSNITSIKLSIPSLNIVNYSLFSGQLAVNASTITTPYTIVTNSTTNIGAYAISIFGLNSSGTATSEVSSSFNVIYPYCANITGLSSPIQLYEITNDDDIKDKDLNPLDSFDIKVKVENTDDEDDYKAIVEAVLVSAKDSSEVDNTDIKEKVTVNSNSKKSVTLEMTIPADIDAGNYYLYVKVTNDDDEDNCEQTSIPVTVKKSTHEIVLNELIVPENVSCGSSATIEGKIINIGKEDEPKVKIVYSDSFGGSSTVYSDDLNTGDDSFVNFVLSVPKNATASAFKNSVTFNIYYDYDEDDESYDEKDTVTYLFSVVGDCNQIISSQTITTETSTAIAGTESEVRVTIANTGTVSQTYSVTASADWADISSISPASVTLASGEQKEVAIKLTPNSGTAIGAHDMTINVQHGSASESKTVSVNVQKSSTPSGIIDQLKFQMKYNPTWVIIDAVLIIAIIIVIVILLSGKKA
jgi:uncharacterized membrane protein